MGSSRGPVPSIARRALLLSLIGCVVLSGPSLAATPAGDSETHRPRTVLVRFRTGGPQQRAAHSTLGARVVRRFARLPGLERVVLPEDRSVSDAVAAYRRDPDVLYAEPDHRVQAIAIPDDPLFGQLWALRNTGQTGAPRHLCNPTHADESAVLRPDMGLTCYRMKLPRGAAPIPAQTITLRNGYEIRSIGVGKPAQLCVPSTRAGGPAPAGEAFACYKGKAPASNAGYHLALDDAFEQRNVLLGAVTTVCAPVHIDGAAIKRPDRFLVCHKLKSVPGQPAFVTRDVPNADQLLAGTLRVSKADVLCLPSREP